MLNQTLNKENIFSIIYLKNKSSHLYFDKPISGTLYYKNYKVDILTWKRSPCSLEHLSSQFRKIKMDNNFEKPIVFHLCYEFGFFFVGEKERILDEDLLAVEIHYEKVSQIQLDNCKTKIEFKLLESPNKEKYKKAYTLGREELLAGNCYQYNLTYPFKYNYDGDITKDLFGDLISTFLNGVERNGAYCHVTNIPLLQKMILSNSPECLFQGKSYKNSFHVWTMPIKGTLPLDDSKSETQVWDELKNCPKNQAELYMISDLLRNDLNKIELPEAKIVYKKIPYKVSGLLHQFSLIDVHCSKNISLYNILKSVYPGGSVTGAPKKQVMKIIDSLEDEKRGFYCGSTLIFYRNIKAASINIRTAVVNTSNFQMLYHSGGGITLQSNWQEEYQEMLDKERSFSLLWADLLEANRQA